MKKILILVILLITVIAFPAACGVPPDRLMADIIKRNQLCAEVLPEAEVFAKVYPQERFEGSVYAGTCDGELVGYVAVVVSKGYKSDIMLMVGVDSHAKVTKVKVLDQKETKGKGSLITSDAYLAQYCGADKNSGGISAVSGATISCDAVYLAVQNTLAIVELIECK